MNQKVEELFADYVEHQLTPAQEEELETLLSENFELKQEFENLKELYDNLEKPTETEPYASMDLGFYMMLEKEKGANKNKKGGNSEKGSTNNDTQQSKGKLHISWLNLNIVKYAAAIIAILGVFWFGRRTADTSLSDIKEIASLKKEVQETRELVMLSMLKQESASERIKAVNYSYDIQKPDKEVLTALIHTFNHDSNTNVRSAAAEAMSHFGNEKRVRDALIQSLLKQNEPTLQITIIDILANLGEKRAVPQMRQLIKNSDTEDFVKRKAQESVKFLTM